MGIGTRTNTSNETIRIRTEPDKDKKNYKQIKLYNKNYLWKRNKHKPQGDFFLRRNNQIRKHLRIIGRNYFKKKCNFPDFSTNFTHRKTFNTKYRQEITGQSVERKRYRQTAKKVLTNTTKYIR